MSHLFISYSHQDAEYVNRLAQALEQAGFLPWVDDRIDYGTTWTGEVQRRLDECAAFLLIMTPRSFESRWVNNELSRAMRKNKPIFPLLLEGEEPWLAVESIQFLDVRGGKLPDERFYQQLATVAERKKPAPEPIPEKKAEPFPGLISAKVPEPIPETPPLSLPVEVRPPEEFPEKQESTKQKSQPEAIKPGKAEEQQAVSAEVVKSRKERTKPGKAQTFSRPVQTISRKWIIGAGMALGVFLLGTGAWFLREPLGLVATNEGTQSWVQTSYPTLQAGTETDPATLTAGPVSVVPITVENAAQITELESWGYGSVISQMDLNTMSDTIAVASSKGVTLIDAGTLETKKFFNYRVDVTAITFQKEGGALAVGLADREITVIKTDGTETDSLPVSATVNSVAINSDGSMLAAGMSDGVYKVFSWDIGDRAYVQLQTSVIYGTSINVVLFSPDDDLLAFGTSKGDIQLRSMSDGSLSQSIKGPPEGVFSLVFSPDGTMLAAGCGDGYIRAWSLSGDLLYELDGMTQKVQSIAFSPDGTMLASGTTDGRIHLWKPEDGSTPIGTLEGLTAEVRSLAFYADAASLFSASLDGKVVSWNTVSLTPVQEKANFSMPVLFTTQKPGTDYLAQGLVDGSIRLQRISEGGVQVMLRGLPDSLGIKFGDADPEKLYSVSSEGIGWWKPSDTTQTDPVMVVESFPAEVTGTAFRQEQIAIGFADATIRWYNEDGSSPLNDWSSGQSDNAVVLLEFDPTTNVLAASYQDGSLIVWQEGGGEDGEEITLFNLPYLGVMTAMTFTPDSGRLLMVGEDGAVRYLSMESRGDIYTLLLPGLGAGVRMMEFNRDGTILALGLEDNRIVLVDYEKQTVLISLEGHTRQITSLTWLEDGKFLVSSSEDGSVRFWGVGE